MMVYKCKDCGTMTTGDAKEPVCPVSQKSVHAWQELKKDNG